MLQTWRTTPGILFIGLAVAFLTGCDHAGKIDETVVTRPEVTVSASRLAQDLRLQVTGRTTSYVTLRNTDNTVIIYTDPQAQVYVNGRRLGANGNIFYERGDVFVPASLESQIRPYLRPSWTPLPPPPQPTEPGPTQNLVKLLPGHGRVLIDPGHGGKDPGTTSAAGLHEKNVVLDVGLKLERDLALSGVKATMTRDNDTFVELDERAAMFQPPEGGPVRRDPRRRRRTDVCDGFTVYIPRNPDYHTRAAAVAVEQAMRSAGFISQGIRQAGYRVVVKNDRPSMLVELGYLSNPAEAEKLGDPGERTIYARALADGIVRYLNGVR